MGLIGQRGLARQALLRRWYAPARSCRSARA
jgi:hypothetical protein